MSIGTGLPQSLRPEAELSLPPQVTGLIEGESLLHISGLKLVDGPHKEQALQIRVQWWGDAGAGTLLQIRSGSGTKAARFPVRCSAGHFQRYLRDMEWLALALEDRFNGMLGEAALAVGELSEQRPLAGAISFIQWLGSGEHKLVATAQLKLLLSFTPIPVPANAAALSLASDTGYHTSSSSGSSQDSLSSRDEDSAGLLGKPESAQEMPDSVGSSQMQSKHALRRPADRQPKEDQTDPQHEQQQHTPQSCEYVRRSAAEPDALCGRTRSQVSATPSRAENAVLGGEPLSLAGEFTGGGRQDRPALAANVTGEGEAPGLAPHEALSRLIRRAEQLRQMINATSAECLSSDQTPAKTGTEDVQHASTSAANTPIIPVTKQEDTRGGASSSAVPSANFGDQHTQHSTATAADCPARCEKKSGNPPADTAEEIQSSISMSTAPTAGKQKRVNDRALPVSKLRRVAEGKSGSLGTGKTLIPQRVTSKQAQDAVLATGTPRSEKSLKLYKDAACQTSAAAALTAPSAFQPSNGASQKEMLTVVASLSSALPSQGAEAHAVGKLKEPLRQAEHLQRRPPQPQISQEGLVRSHSAPALYGANSPPLATSETSQLSAQTHRSAGQHGTPSLLATEMQHSSGQRKKLRRMLQQSSKPKTPSTSDRQAWCNTFNLPRQRPAGQNTRGGSKQPFPSASPSHPQLHLSASLQQAPTLQALLPAGQPSQLLTGSAGFCGQPARATIQIQSACILPGKPAFPQKPTYSVMYRLPGDAALQLTPKVEARACDDAANSGTILHVPLDHATAHWVIADEKLAQRLLSTPMLATVLLHHHAKRGDLPPQPVPVGTAEVDMSGLLLPRLGAVCSERRAVSGTYPLIHPGAKSLHGASVTIKVSLDLDPPNAQQALPGPQKAAMPEQFAALRPAPALHDSMRKDFQEQPGGKALPGGHSRGAWADAGARQQGCLRPATAETSTEYFARMEVCSAQPASANGAASKSLGTMHELDSSAFGQQGHAGQPEDLLAAWRQLSDMDRLPHGQSLTEPSAEQYASPELDDELAWVSQPQLAASWDPYEALLQAPLTDESIANAYTLAAWDGSDSPGMLMGSPDQHSQQQPSYIHHGRTSQSSHFPDSPDQLPQASAARIPMLRWDPENTSQPFSSLPWQDFSLASMEAQSPEQLTHRGLSEAPIAQPCSPLGLQIDVSAGVSEQGFYQPSEKHLYATLARFWENLSQLPAGSPASKADLAAMSLLSSQTQHVEQEVAPNPDALEQDPAQDQDTGDHRAYEQGISAEVGHSSAASEANQDSGLTAAMYIDTLEPDGATQALLGRPLMHTARLATFSDDEDFAVLDFGGGSGGSSERSFGAEGTVGQHETVYSAPRGALIMPGAYGASDDWLFGLGNTLPDSCHPTGPDAPREGDLALGGAGVGGSHERPGRAQSAWNPTMSGDSPAQPRMQGGFSFTNMLPPGPANDDTERTDWSSERSIPAASCPAASSPEPAQARDDSRQAGRDSNASGEEPPTSDVTEQHVSAGDSEHIQGSAQPDMGDDLSEIFLSSLSLCSPGACEPTPVPEPIQVPEPPALGEQQQSASKIETAALPSSSVCPSSDVTDLEQDAVSQHQPNDDTDKHAVFVNLLPHLDDQPSTHSSGSKPVFRANARGGRQSVIQAAPGTGMSRREEFRQKLAAAQSARLGATDEPGPVLVSPGGAATVSQHMQTGSPGIKKQEHCSEGCKSPLQKEPLHAAASADAHNSRDDNRGADLAPLMPSTFARDAASLDEFQSPRFCGDDPGTPDEGSSCASSEAEEARPGIGDLPNDAADGSNAEVQWAENAAAGGSNYKPEGISACAIRRMSAVARARGQRSALGQYTGQYSEAAAHPPDQPHDGSEESEAAQRTQGSLSSSSGRSACGVTMMPNEAADGSDTAVHWAENTALAREAIGDGEESDEVLLHAMRRMSVVAREHASGSSPSAESLSTAGLDHPGSVTPRALQQSMHQRDGKSDSPMLPSLQHTADAAVSPVTMRQPDTEQSGQGALPTGLMHSPCAAGPVHGLYPGHAHSSPARGSYEQLLARFEGSPAPERCFTPPPGPAAPPVAKQAPGFKAGLSVSGGGAVMEPGQLGSPQWRRRSPLPICSPAHAYMAGQSSPPGALGARLRDLEPRLVLPALRALWGHDRDHPRKTAKQAGDGGSATSTQELIAPGIRDAEVPIHDLTDAPHPPAPADYATHTAKIAVAHSKSSLHTTLTVTRDSGGRSRAGTRPAARRGNFDPEAERIAQIMASNRASPWQHRQGNSPQG